MHNGVPLNLILKLIHGFDKVLGANDSRDADGLSGGDGSTGFGPCGRGVTRAAPNIGNLTDAVFGDGCDDGSGLAHERSDADLAGALGFFEHPIEKEKGQRSHDETGHGRNRGANPNAFGSVDTSQDQAAGSKSSNETRKNGRTEERNAWDTAVVVTGFGVAAGSDVHVAVMTAAEEMACESADDGEQKTESQANDVDNHKSSLKSLPSLK